MPPDDGVRWSDLTIAIVGGDDREQVIARLAAETGAEVRAFGFPWPEGGIPGVTASKSAAEAIEGARYALFPIPGLQDGKLFAEGTSEPIHPDEELLSRLAPGALIIGNSDDAMDECAGRLGIPVDNYEGDEELMRLRAPAIVEGAISIAVQNTDRTLHMSEIAVVGFGNMGRQVAQTLLALRASVHVVARNPLQRAAAYALGAQPAPLEELPELAPDMLAIFSTVPAPIVDRTVLSRLPDDGVAIDIAAPPGSVDFEAAAELGVRAVWARGLGKRAPVTVGRSQWYGIRQRIEAAEAERGGS